MVDEPTDDPTFRRREFGLVARYHRGDRLTCGDADRLLGPTRGKLSKIENGRQAADAAYVERMIQLYALSGTMAEEFRDLGVQARRRSAPARVPRGSQPYLSFERRASEIRLVSGEIPGLLQTADFARAALSVSPSLPSGDVERHAQARSQRSAWLREATGTRLRACLGEASLRREVGGPAVLRKQLAWLRELGRLPYVSIRIVADTAGPCPGLSCPFTLLTVPPVGVIVHTASLAGSIYPRGLSVFEAGFAQAEQIANSDADSDMLITARLADLLARM